MPPAGRLQNGRCQTDQSLPSSLQVRHPHGGTRLARWNLGRTRIVGVVLSPLNRNSSSEECAVIGISKYQHGNLWLPDTIGRSNRDFNNPQVTSTARNPPGSDLLLLLHQRPRDLRTPVARYVVTRRLEARRFVRGIESMSVFHILRARNMRSRRTDSLGPFER